MAGDCVEGRASGLSSLGPIIEQRAVRSEVSSGWVELPILVAYPIEEPALAHSPSLPDPSPDVEREVPDVTLGFREAIRLPPNHDVRLLLGRDIIPPKLTRLCPASSEPSEVSVLRVVEDQGQFPRTGEPKRPAEPACAEAPIQTNATVCTSPKNRGSPPSFTSSIEFLQVSHSQIRRVGGSRFTGKLQRRRESSPSRTPAESV